MEKKFKNIQYVKTKFIPMKKMEEFIEMKKLVDRIYQFIDKYAGIRPDWDAQYDD
jgi:hypothetical protein